ncbi:MAG: YciI family protein [Rhizomicrobium sp.]
MLFVLTAIDKPDALELRMATRAAHFEYAKQTGVIRMGGPFLDAGGDMAGSLIIFEAADPDAAKAWAANDPYAKAGLFASSDVRRWKLTFNPKGVEF